MTTLLLDSHTLHWWTAEPERLSKTASKALDDVDDLAVASITWYELAWLAEHARIVVAVPVRTWLDRMGAEVRTVTTTPSIAATAVSLPQTFPRDPADRLIFATAIETGWQLVTKDRRLHDHRHPRQVTIW